MRPIDRIITWATTLATAAVATIVLTGSPAAADGGGYWANQCDYGRACIKLGRGHTTMNGPIWNVIGCGSHQINDYYGEAMAQGNSTEIYYIDNRWDDVAAWSSRPLDENNLATNIWVNC
ncbi:hypothetical protein OHA44_36915 [Streptomyces sp. NBC_00144]|uniref:hypothetical protein n=1 Tax=Streptomyces sp. NBC_00144 TaxID=2975665 RepID=UPI00324AB851